MKIAKEVFKFRRKKQFGIGNSFTTKRTGNRKFEGKGKIVCKR